MYRITLLAVVCVLSSCTSDSFYGKLFRKGELNKHYYQGHFKIGQKYTIKNVTYTPQPAHKPYKAVGKASWYGKENGFHGNSTANGDKYNKNMLTAAHPTLPLPSIVRVTNLHNNKQVMVMVNDRGPFKSNRIIDVSEKAAKVLGFKNQGVARVQVEYMQSETKSLWDKLSLKPQDGAKSTGKIKNSRCLVDCHIKLINERHNIKIE